MTDLPRLTESGIQRWIGEPSFRRGQSYYSRGKILNPRRQGETLKALCSGSRLQPYRVEVALGSLGIVSAGCSCPVGGGGRCKHTAALLLTWLYESESFQEIEDLLVGLRRRSKAELVALILKMIHRYPDLEVLFDLPTAGSAGGSSPMDPELIRRQVNVVITRAGNDWRAASRAALDLLDILELGEEYAQYKNWRYAATVYETVARVATYTTVPPARKERRNRWTRCIYALTSRPLPKRASTPNAIPMTITFFDCPGVKLAGWSPLS